MAYITHDTTYGVRGKDLYWEYDWVKANEWEERAYIQTVIIFEQKFELRGKVADSAGHEAK